MIMEIIGRINSIQTLGTLDGPGVRFVVFMQGCNLRCGCCHNPETQQIGGGTEYTAQQIVDKAERYREYFGEKGGITLTGGEPLLQPEFATEVFRLCKQRGISTCLDTSGSILSSKIYALLNYTDYALLDIKYTDNAQYEQYVGCSMKTPLEFLGVLQQKGIKTVLRQVTIPTLNDNAENISLLKDIKQKHSCVEKIELLPFKKLCKIKYEELKIPFLFDKFNEPTAKKMEELNNSL